MKKLISKLSQIDSEDFNFSHIGDASAKQFLYLLEKKKDIDNLFQNKKVKKAEPQDFWHEKEKDLYDDIFEKDEYEDDIFDKEYDIKYKKELQEKRQKYEPPKNSCAYFEKTIKVEQQMNKKTKKENKKEIEEGEEKEEKEISNVKKRADIEKQLRYELQNERYKYHLIHHHHDLYVDKSLLNLNEQVSSNSYKPKLEYVFKKIIYSPEFNKMSGRYDQELKRGINENKKEIIIKNLKEKEYAKNQKRLKKEKNKKHKTFTNNETRNF